MCLDYNRDRGSGTIVSKKRFLESIFEVRQCSLTPCSPRIDPVLTPY
jgi:hypothetical protein